MANNNTFTVATMDDWYSKVASLYTKISETKPSTSGLSQGIINYSTKINELINNITNLYNTTTGNLRVYFSYADWTNVPTTTEVNKLVEELTATDISTELSALAKVCINNSVTDSYCGTSSGDSYGGNDYSKKNTTYGYETGNSTYSYTPSNTTYGNSGMTTATNTNDGNTTTQTNSNVNYNCLGTWTSSSFGTNRTMGNKCQNGTSNITYGYTPNSTTCTDNTNTTFGNATSNSTYGYKSENSTNTKSSGDAYWGNSVDPAYKNWTNYEYAVIENQPVVTCTNHDNIVRI